MDLNVDALLIVDTDCKDFLRSFRWDCPKGNYLAECDALVITCVVMKYIHNVILAILSDEYQIFIDRPIDEHESSSIELKFPCGKNLDSMGNELLLILRCVSGGFG